MATKKKGDATGTVFPLRASGESEIFKCPIPELEKLRRSKDGVWTNELEDLIAAILVKEAESSNEHQFKHRISELEEAVEFMKLSKTLVQSNFHQRGFFEMGIHVGVLIAVAAHRLYKEPIAHIGQKQRAIGEKRASESQQRKRKVTFDRDSLLKQLRNASGSNHKERCAVVAEKNNVSQRTIESHCAQLKIRSKDCK